MPELNAKHTPGPWIVRGNHICETTERDRHSTIAVISGPNFWPEMGANARLIAAAPELYEALKEVVKNWGSSTALGTYIETPGFEKARAAIAKAEKGGS